MKKLFLTSSFADVAIHFKDFIQEELTDKTVTFIPTASRVESITFYVDNDRNAFKQLGIRIDECDIATTPTERIAEQLKKNDYIFVTGGNTFYLLQELKKSGADQLITEQILSGKPYIGSSAGSIVLSPQIEYIKAMDDEKKAPDLSDYQGLNLIDVYPLPHFGNFPYKKETAFIYQNYHTTHALVKMSNTEFLAVQA